MSYRDPVAFMHDLSSFFSAHFDSFSLHEPYNILQECAYYLNYKHSKLSLVVFLPVARDSMGQLVMTCQKIRIVLKKTNGRAEEDHLVIMENVRLMYGWKRRLQERIAVLKELVEKEVHRCPACDVIAMPEILRKKNAPHTQFVALRCPQCKKCTWTTFGRGFKTLLHKNLKKNGEK